MAGETKVKWREDRQDDTTRIDETRKKRDVLVTKLKA